MAEERSVRLSGGQRLAVAVSVLLGLGLAAYGVAGSYKTVSVLAAKRGVPLAPLVPVGIDGGLIGVIVLDLVLSWTGQPIGWLRQLVRALTVGTVAANAAAGWPDLVSAGLHAAAALMLLAMVEAGRTVLLRRIGGLAGQARDPIPAARWLLAPWSTWLMWRRMVLWQAGGFHAALEAEQERRHVVVLLRARYGRRWRRHRRDLLPGRVRALAVQPGQEILPGQLRHRQQLPGPEPAITLLHRADRRIKCPDHAQPVTQLSDCGHPRVRRQRPVHRADTHLLTLPLPAAYPCRPIGVLSAEMIVTSQWSSSQVRAAPIGIRGGVSRS